MTTENFVYRKNFNLQSHIPYPALGQKADKTMGHRGEGGWGKRKSERFSRQAESEHRLLLCVRTPPVSCHFEIGGARRLGGAHLVIQGLWHYWLKDEDLLTT